MSNGYEYDSYDDSFLTNAKKAQQIEQKKDLSKLRRLAWTEGARAFFIACCGLGVLFVLVGVALYFGRKEKIVDRVETVTREIVREIPIEIESNSSIVRNAEAENIEEINATIAESANQDVSEVFLPDEFTTFTTVPYSWDNPTSTGSEEVIVGKTYLIGTRVPSLQWCYIMQENSGAISERIELLSFNSDIVYTAGILLSEAEFERAQALCSSVFN